MSVLRAVDFGLRVHVGGTAAPYSWGAGRSTGLLACTGAPVVGTGLAEDASRKRPHLTTFWRPVVGFRESEPEAGEVT